MTHYRLPRPSRRRPTSRPRPHNPFDETPVEIADTVTDPDGARYYKRDFWAAESRKYAQPHFRMRKLAREVARVADGRRCDLLDVGCGPAALAALLPPTVRYHGVDIAIGSPAPNLRELDVVSHPIGFDDKRFDIVVAGGLFEYVGRYQSQKLAEIADLLAPGGTFIVTYTNFAHRSPQIYWPYSNIQRPEAFRADLDRWFVVRRTYAGSHNWSHSQPHRPLVQALQARLDVDVPLLSRRLAVDYFYECTLRPSSPRRPSGDAAGDEAVLRI